MKTNTFQPKVQKTHEGAVASVITPEQQLRRSVMCCMLWEDTFYESGEAIADRIVRLVSQVTPEVSSAIAIEARNKFHLRHAPLWIVNAMVADHQANPKRYAGTMLRESLIQNTLAEVIQRPDELTEFLALYWKNGRKPLAAQVKKGLAKAFTKFDEYQLAKYNRDEPIKLRDVLFLCHAKPKDAAQAEVWKRLVDGNLETPDTWEVALSASGNTKENWERLLNEHKLGSLALLRNLRNMESAKVSSELIHSALLEMRTEKVFPYRFFQAYTAAPNYKADLERVMMLCLKNREKLPGFTVLLVDVSGSMDDKISGKSEVLRADVAAALAVLIRELSDNCVIIPFDTRQHTDLTMRGFELSKQIHEMVSGGTMIQSAIDYVNQRFLEYDRLIVITDEQSHENVSDPKGVGYMINVGSYQNGVGYGKWNHIDGWSEAILDYIVEFEKSGL